MLYFHIKFTLYLLFVIYKGGLELDFTQEYPILSYHLLGEALMASVKSHSAYNARPQH